ncbi:MAG: chromosomal replication initiator protein DnaA [Butyricicoccus sp.]|jgi:chromosomal replication initiator protein|nr:chromosomal replication initiator protein DnaA [Clostridiales bacterium]
MTPNDIWKMVLELLQKDLTQVTMDAWFSDLTAVEFQNDRFVLHTPDSFKQEIIEARYLDNIKSALHELFSADIDVVITTGEFINNNQKKEKNAEDEYTFKQFIVGSSNKFAHAAATAVANNPGRSYNPLFIYGQSGLGKTHLLYAIASAVRGTYPNDRIIYIKGEDFTNELINSIQTARVQEFRDKYRSSDVLLVDDVQFIAGKDSTQEEFFHTFNTLYESKKQIVLTSDRPPKEINLLEDRLKTRFEWGLIADIQPPDYETRIAIIRLKAESLGIELSSEINDYIATTITANVRQLEGTVKKIKALHELMGREIDKSLAEEAITDIFKENPGMKPTPEIILQEVSNFYTIPVEKLRGSGRSRDMVQPRQVAMYLVRKLTDYSLPEIGKVFSRDHTTVLHSINKVEEYLKTTTEMENIIKTLIANIRN